MLTLPNFLTLLRILAVPVFLIVVVNGDYGWGLVVFFLAGFTDSIDGAIARIFDSYSDLGASLDPVADKLILVSAFLSLGWIGAVPPWLVILTFMRDITILGGYITIYFVSKPMTVDPTFLGKLNTFNEMFTIGFALLTLARPDIPMGMINEVLWIATGITTTLSGTHYVYMGLLFYQREGAKP